MNRTTGEVHLFKSLNEFKNFKDNNKNSNYKWEFKYCKVCCFYLKIQIPSLLIVVGLFFSLSNHFLLIIGFGLP